MVEYMNNRGKRPLPHFLQDMLYEDLEEEGFFKMDPNALIYKDMEKLEYICNKVLDNGEVNVVHSPNPMSPPRVVKHLKVAYETNEMGFVIPQSCNFKLFF